MGDEADHDGLGSPGDRILLEAGLRRAVLAGNPSAWRHLFERSYPALDAHVRYRTGGDRILADEIIQETWMVAVKRLKDFDPRRAAFGTWLRGIAANLLRAHARKEPTGEAVGPLDVERQSVQARTGSESTVRIRAALLRLPERYREVLRAKYMEQLSTTEIAATLDLTPKAVESLLSRARNAFKRIFSKKDEGA